LISLLKAKDLDPEKEKAKSLKKASKKEKCTKDEKVWKPEKWAQNTEGQSQDDVKMKIGEKGNTDFPEKIIVL